MKLKIVKVKNLGKMKNPKLNIIQEYASDGNIKELSKVLSVNENQLEIDIALESAVAYSKIEVAKYLLSLGADFSNYDYQSVYYAVHNNELKGLIFSISEGVDININNGMPLNTSILTAINTKSLVIIKWLLENGADKNLLTDKSKSIVKKFGSPELKILLEL
jgi:ankyrin repeat protein